MEALLAVERFSGEAQVNATFLLDSHVVKCGDESMYGLDTGAWNTNLAFITHPKSSLGVAPKGKWYSFTQLRSCERAWHVESNWLFDLHSSQLTWVYLVAET